MITDKPWGSEELLELNDQYCLKRLTMKENHRCSLQYHEHKTETIYVISGILRIILIDEDSDKEMICRLYADESMTIRAGRTHRMEGATDCIYLEASTPEMDDVIRIEDDYERE